MCAKCEKPFYGHRYFEWKGLAYYETHYNEVRDQSCTVAVVGGVGKENGGGNKREDFCEIYCNEIRG